MFRSQHSFSINLSEIILTVFIQVSAQEEAAVSSGFCRPNSALLADTAADASDNDDDDDDDDDSDGGSDDAAAAAGASSFTIALPKRRCEDGPVRVRISIPLAFQSEPKQNSLPN